MLEANDCLKSRTVRKKSAVKLKKAFTGLEIWWIMARKSEKSLLAETVPKLAKEN